MKSIPIAIVVVLLTVGGVWFFFDRVETHTVQEDDVTVQAEILPEGGRLAILERDINFDGGRKEFYVEPFDDGVSRGMYPGVILVHEWWGLTDHIRSIARDLAGYGYKVLAVDLYSGQVATTSDDAMKYRSLVTEDESMRLLREAVRFLREQQATKVGVLGWGFGGGEALKVSLSGEPLDATAIYFAELITDPARLSVLTGPVLGVFGGADRSIPIEKVKEFESALASAGVSSEIDIYPDAGYAFTNPKSSTYSHESAQDAWRKTLLFLKKSLKE